MSNTFKTHFMIAVFIGASSVLAFTQVGNTQGAKYVETCVEFSIESTSGAYFNKAEYPTTGAEVSYGMKHRHSIADDEFMIFNMGNTKAGFWMQDTVSSLDLAFFDVDAKLVHIERSATPLSEEMIVAPGNPDISYVIEMRAGRADALDLSVGDSELNVSAPVMCADLDEAS